MPDTIKKGVIKQKTGSSSSVILYPKTTSDQIEYESKIFTLSNISSLPASYDYFLAELVPDDLQKAYSATFDILVENDGIIVSSTQTMWLHSYRCTFGSQTYYLDLTSSNPVTYPSLTAYQWLNGDTRTGSGNYYFKTITMRTLRGNNCSSAITAGHGHIFGLRNDTTGSFSTSGNIKITVKVYETINCKIKFLDSITSTPSNTNLTLNGYIYNSWGNSWLSNTYGEWLQSNSIENARTTVSVNNVNNSNTSYYYVTGALSTGITSEGRNSNIYIRQGRLYSNRGLGINSTTYYQNYISYYDGDNDDYYDLEFPAKNGTLATLDDAQIPIEDLTNINNN